MDDRRRRECSNVMKDDIFVDIAAQTAMTVPTVDISSYLAGERRPGRLLGMSLSR